MGWWKIDPATGTSLEDTQSALSQSPDFVLLNAVPGVDDEALACYLGDGPWDMASTMPAEITAVIGEGVTLSDEQIRDLLLRRVAPASAVGGRPEIGSSLMQVVDAFWHDVDACYEDDWERPATPAEKRWVCEYVVEALKRNRS